MPWIRAFISAAALLGSQAVRSVTLAQARAANLASQECFDSPQAWVDPDGDTCEVYAEKGWCHAGWISRWNNTGRTANEACCKCGGGVKVAAGEAPPAAVTMRGSIARGVAPDAAGPVDPWIRASPASLPHASAQSVSEHHNFAGVHPSRLPTDIATAVAEGSLDMATAVAAGVWPPKIKSSSTAAAHSAAQPPASSQQKVATSDNPYTNSLADLYVSNLGSDAQESSAPSPVTGHSHVPVEATMTEPGTKVFAIPKAERPVEEFAPPKQQASNPYLKAFSKAESFKAAFSKPPLEESTHPKEQFVEPATPEMQKLDAPANADASSDDEPVRLDAAGRRNPLLAWNVEDLQKEAYYLQTELSKEQQEKEDVLRRDGVEIGGLQDKVQSKNAEIQELKHRASALEMKLNSSQAQQQKEQTQQRASFQRLEKLFHQLERKAEAVQGQEKWDHKEVQQLQSRAVAEHKHAASWKNADSHLQVRLRETTSNLTRAMALAAAEKKTNAGLLGWKAKATKAIQAQGAKLKAEKALEQKMKGLLAKEKENDHQRDEKMYALELRVQKAEAEKRSLLKKAKDQQNRIYQLEAGEDVNFDDDERVMTQSRSSDQSEPSTTTTSPEPVVEEKVPQTPLLSSWARLIPEYGSKAQVNMANAIPQDTLPPTKVTSADSTVAGVPQEIRQSSALWNLWKQSSI